MNHYMNLINKGDLYYYFVLIFTTIFFSDGVKSQQELLNQCSTSCTLLKDCPSAFYELMKYKIYPNICYYNQSLPYICCPLQNRKRCSFVDLETRISTENNADPEAFEFMVALSWNIPFQEYYACGGTLIHKLHVLTAAHCVYNNGSYTPIRYALVGGGSINNGNDPIKIVAITQHPEYHQKKKYHDIAILKLEKEVNYQPACLPPPYYELLPQTEVAAVGYGQISFYGDSSVKLLRADLQIYSQYNCSQYYGILFDSQLCALGASIYKKNSSIPVFIDTCQGDSGGPLVTVNKDSSIQPAVIGIISFGYPCGSGYPGVYTKVSFYYDWIMENISNDGKR